MSLSVIYFGLLILGIIGSVFGPLIPWFVQDFALSLSVAGRLFLFMGLGRILTSIYMGIAGDRHQDKNLVQLGIIIMGLPCLLVFLFPSFYLVLLTAFIWGTGWSFLEGGANALVGRLNQGKSGSSLNKLHVFFGVGALIGPVIASSFATFIHWRFLYLVLFLLYTTFGVLLHRLDIPERTAPQKTKEQSQAAIPFYYFWFFALILFLYVAQEVAMGGWLNTYWATIFETRQIFASAIVTGFWIALTLGRMLCSYLMKKYPRLLIMQGMLVGLVVSYLLLYLSPWMISSGVLVILLGLLMAGIAPTILSLGLDAFPDKQISVSGILSVAAGLGVMLGPWLAGLILDNFSVALLPVWGLFISFWLLGGFIYLSKKLVATDALS